jgi:hypothetical protein
VPDLEDKWTTERFQREAEELQAMVDRWGESNDAMSQAITTLQEGSAAREVSPDAKLSLEELVCLPELGGFTAVKSAYDRPSDKFTVRIVRQWLEKGLPYVQPGKNIFVTPHDLKEFLDKWRATKNPNDSGSDQLASTRRPGRSPTKRSGSSSTTEAKLSQDALNLSVDELLKSFGSTKRRSIGKRG